MYLIPTSNICPNCGDKTFIADKVNTFCFCEGIGGIVIEEKVQQRREEEIILPVGQLALF